MRKIAANQSAAIKPGEIKGKEFFFFLGNVAGGIRLHSEPEGLFERATRRVVATMKAVWEFSILISPALRSYSVDMGFSSLIYKHLEGCS